MTMQEKDWDQWFIEQFDRYVAGQHDEAPSVDKSRDAVATAYAEGVRHGRIERRRLELETEGRELFDRLVMPERDHRRASFRVSARYLVDAITDQTVLGEQDPVLDQAYPIGDGTDKTLRYWNPEDWNTSRTIRYRQAAEHTRAAQEWDVQVVSPIVAAMRQCGARRTEDLLTPPGGEDL